MTIDWRVLSAGFNQALTREPGLEGLLAAQQFDLRQPQPVAGEPWYFLIDLRGDGILTHRWTTPVVAIRPWESDPTPDD